MTRRIVVIGAGMVGNRVVTELVRRGVAGEGTGAEVVLIGEEPRRPYDRVHLSSYAEGAEAEDLDLVEDDVAADPAVAIRLGRAVTSIDTGARTFDCADGTSMAYDELVLATGSFPFVPPIPGGDREHCFVYRTLDDIDRIRGAAGPGRRGVVIGGGLLGLEAANALRLMGCDVSVVEFAPRLMPVQLDDGGARALQARIAALGIDVRVDHQTASIDGIGETARVTGLTFADDTTLDADLVVFSAGIRPRDDLARMAGLALGERGGVLVDEACRTSGPAVWAVGECVVAHGRTWGLVAPGYDMAGSSPTGWPAGTRCSTRPTCRPSSSCSGSTSPPSATPMPPRTAPWRSSSTTRPPRPTRSSYWTPTAPTSSAPCWSVTRPRTAGCSAWSGGAPRSPTAPAPCSPRPPPGAVTDDTHDLACTCNTVTYGDLRAAVRDGGARPSPSSAPRPVPAPGAAAASPPARRS